MFNRVLSLATCLVAACVAVHTTSVVRHEGADSRRDATQEAPASAVSPAVKTEALVEVRVATFHAKALDEDRRAAVYLPHDYDAAGPGYPTLYMPATEGDYQHFTTGVTRILSMFGGLPKMIVVGLRDVVGSRDLTPTRLEANPDSGGADRFLTHIRGDVIPWVEATFNTAPTRLLWGHSIVGAFAIYAFLSQPDLFQCVIASSPYLVYDRKRRHILNNAGSWLGKRGGRPGALYFTVGDEPGLRPSTEELNAILTAEVPEDVRFRFRHLKGESHRSTLPLTFPAGLRWYFEK